MNDKKSRWLWYYGDYELYHSKQVHSRRTEQTTPFPAFWYIPEVYSSVRFRKKVDLARPETITVYANGIGSINLFDVKYPLEKPIELPAGEYEFTVGVINPTGIPAVYVEGETVISDEDWDADYYTGKWKKVGLNDAYCDKDVSPDKFIFEYTELTPASVSQRDGGTLYDFGEETFAQLRFTRLNKPITVYYGESEIEALDTKYSYMCDRFSPDTISEIPFAKGFRYLYIPDFDPEDGEFSVFYEHLPTKRRGSFECDDEKLNRIWSVAAHTFELNSREFYLDGIKRDRWVWSGDSFQSYFINRYLCLDEEIDKRTIIALGGKGPIEQHINTILDYTFYWIISIYNYYEISGDVEFVRGIYPRMKEYMEFCLGRLDENGFAGPCNGDWIFIDWNDHFDKTGAFCPEQMLLLRSLESMAVCAELVGEDREKYSKLAINLKKKINDYYWCEEKGAYIDSFESGKKNVSRHANIFALLFGYADKRQRKLIIENVILNDRVPQITTPYFKFYELESLCAAEKYDCVIDRMSDYWGAMIDIGATSFWESFDPTRPWQDQLAEYGSKYGESLCHAWGASPIYLIGRYFLGVRPTSPGYRTFEVAPHLERFVSLKATVPVKGGTVTLKKHDGNLTVKCDRDGGTVIYCGNRYTLEKDTEITLS